MDDIPIFRAPKRRRFNKPATQAEDNPTIDTFTLVSPDHSASENANDENKPAVIRAQRQSASRKTGISFSASTRAGQFNRPDAMALIPSDAPSPPMTDIPSRFVNPGGQVANVDKHMYVSSLPFCPRVAGGVDG